MGHQFFIIGELGTGRVCVGLAPCVKAVLTHIGVGVYVVPAYWAAPTAGALSDILVMGALCHATVLHLQSTPCVVAGSGPLGT
jgi:hypothetical protein